MGGAHKTISVSLRIFEFAFAVVILGFLAKFFRLLHIINGPTDPRLVYAISMASISAALAIVLSPPMKYSYYLFPIDFALFICWIVCFALLEDLTGARTCSSSWLATYWTVYWDADSGNSIVATGSGCSKWRVVLAFSFIIASFWLLSAFLGLYVSVEYFKLGAKTVSIARKLNPRKKLRDADLEKDAPKTGEKANLPKIGNPYG